MADSRGHRLLQLVQNDKRLLDLLDSHPKHESTKGTSAKERDAFFKHVGSAVEQKLNLDGVAENLEVLKRAETETTPSRPVSDRAQTCKRNLFHSDVEDHLKMVPSLADKISTPVQDSENQPYEKQPKFDHTAKLNQSVFPPPVRPFAYKTSTTVVTSNANLYLPEDVNTKENLPKEKQPEFVRLPSKLNVQYTNESSFSDGCVAGPSHINFQSRISDKDSSSDTDDTFNDRDYLPDISEEDTSDADSGKPSSSKKSMHDHEELAFDLNFDIQISASEGDKNNVCKKKRKTDESSKKSKKSKRNKNFCFYCESYVLDFSRHIARNHSQELDVQKILVAPKGQDRSNLITELRKKGNFISAAAGIVKPMKRLVTSSPSKAVSCPYCLGFYSRRRLWRHKKTCSEKHNKEKNRLVDCKNLLSKGNLANAELVKKVFPRMHPSTANMTAKCDPLICAYGTKFLKTHRQVHQANVCSRKMRELAFILIEIKKIDNNITNLLQALKPEYFDKLVESAKKAAGYDETKGTFRDAAFAMNISTALKECCEIAIFDAAKKKHTVRGAMYSAIQEELNTTIILIKSQWKTEISHIAADHLHAKKMNKISIVPLAADLKILREYLINQGEKATETLLNNPNCSEAFEELTKSLYCRLLLLNRKRPGELQRLTVEAYNQSHHMSNTYEEFEKSVTPTEKILLRKFKRVVIKGKRKYTPVLFSPDMQKCMDILIKVRDNFVNDENKSIFTLPNSAHPILGYKVLQQFAKKAKCTKPEGITTRGLRKHLATICQLFHMSDEDVEQLSTFMGHSQATHRKNYRLPDDVFQTAKITKLLLMMEQGEGVQYKGMTLDEIDVELEDEVHPENEDYSDEESETDLLHSISAINSSSDVDLPSYNVKGKQRKREKEVHAWTNDQKRIVVDFFKNEIAEKRPPKKHQVIQLYELNPNLNLPKQWEKVKVFIQNVYTNKTKLPI